MFVVNRFSLFLNISVFFCVLAFASIGRAEVSESDSAAKSIAQVAPIIPDSVILDGRDYAALHIFQAWMATVFSPNTDKYSLIYPHTELLFPDLNNKEKNPFFETSTQSTPKNFSKFWDPQRFKENYSWVYEAVFRSEGMPKTAVVNKWQESIKISIGFPNHLQPESTSNIPTEYYLEAYGGVEPQIVQNPDVEKKIEAIIKDAIPKLKIVTGLDIDYINPSNNIVKPYSNLNIVILTNNDFGGTHFKDGVGYNELIVRGYPKPLNFRSDIEPVLRGKIRFTPDSNKQVDGYILPNGKNEITSAFCFVWQGHDDKLLPSIINECLLRSLGLPGGVRNTPYALSSYWNDPEKWFPPYRPFLPAQPPQLSQFDLFMVQTLYNHKIHAGMDINAAIDVLIKK